MQKLVSIFLFMFAVSKHIASEMVIKKLCPSKEPQQLHTNLDSKMVRTTRKMRKSRRHFATFLAQKLLKMTF